MGASLTMAVLRSMGVEGTLVSLRAVDGLLGGAALGAEEFG